MLVLSRRLKETVVLDCGITSGGVAIGGITITVVDVRGNQVRLGIEAPQSIAIRRGELPDNASGERYRLTNECVASAG